RGTVLSRLARGRERLRRELVRRGVVPAIAALALAESESTVSAALVTAAMHTINHGAAGPVAGLAQGVIREMTLTQIETTACTLLAVGVIGMGTWFVAGPGAQAGSEEPPKREGKPPAARKQPADDKPVDELARLRAENAKLRDQLKAERIRVEKLEYQLRIS